MYIDDFRQVAKNLEPDASAATDGLEPFIVSLAVSAKRQADAWERVADALAIRKGESDYASFCANEQPDGTIRSLETAADMMERWAAETFPANPDGKVHFGRAMMDSASKEIRAFLANFSAVVASE